MTDAGCTTLCEVAGASGAPAFGVWGFGYGVWDLEVGFWVSRLGRWDFEFWVSVQVSGFWVHGSAVEVLGLKV